MTWPIQNMFTGGELSPRLAARIDTSYYGQGCKTLENFLIHPHGGASRRPGTRFVAEVKDSSKAVRLIPFQFSVTQAYVLELGDQYLRFYMDQGQIQDGGSPYEIASPYAAADLFELQWCQSADVMYLVHPDYAPRKLSRTGHTSWTLATVSFTSQPSEWDTNNWPSCVTFYEQRLVFAGVPSHPQTIWMSRTNSYEDFTLNDPLQDDDRVKFTLVADQVNVIRWLTATRNLLVGTVGGEWEVYSDGPLTPANPTAQRYTTHGSANAMPLMIENAVLFIQRNGKKVRELAYVFESDGYLAPDIMIRSEHLTRTHSILDWTYQHSPDSIAWAVRSDGQLMGLTYLRKEQILAWHRHTTQGEFQSVACIPGTSNDEVWAVVKRTVDGSTKRYIEFFENEFVSDDVSDAFFVDCGLSYDGSATSTISGLDHLEGEEVAILADGSVRPRQTVASGDITLSSSASKIHAGLPYESVLETMNLEAGARNGTAQGRTKRINRLVLRLDRSLGGWVGPDEAKMDQLLFRTSNDAMGQALPLFTGDKTITFPGGQNTHGRIRIKQTMPLPLTVLAVIPEVDTSRR